MAHNITTAIFPVGGLGTRFLPATKAMPKEMLPVVDKPLIQYAVEEAIEAGITKFIFVTSRGKSVIEDHFDQANALEQLLTERRRKDGLDAINASRLEAGAVAYIRQPQPAGLGHAIWCARHYMQNEPVAVLLADDLIQPKQAEQAKKAGRGCLAEMIEAWHAQGGQGNMVAASNVRPEEVAAYGIITAGPDSGRDDGTLVEVKGLIEKPAPENAPSTLAVVGRYILEAGFGTRLDSQAKNADEIQLTDALAKRIGKVPFFAYRFSGRRFDCGNKLGFLQANIALGLERADIGSTLKTWMQEQ